MTTSRPAPTRWQFQFATGVLVLALVIGVDAVSQRQWLLVAVSALVVVAEAFSLRDLRRRRRESGQATAGG